MAFTDTQYGHNRVVSRVTGTSNISEIFDPSEAFLLKSIRLHLNVPATGGELTGIVSDAIGLSSEYDTKFLAEPMNLLQDLIWTPEEKMEFVDDDSLDLAWSDASTQTWGLQVRWEILP